MSLQVGKNYITQNGTLVTIAQKSFLSERYLAVDTYGFIHQYDGLGRHDNRSMHLVTELS